MKQILSSIDNYLAITAILINLIFVVLVLFRTSRTALYTIFLFICISVMFWNFYELMNHFYVEVFWYYFALICSALIPTLMFHFIITLVRPARKNTTWITLAYAFSCLLAFISFSAIFNPRLQNFIQGTYWDIFYFVLFSPFFLGGIIMLVNAIYITKSNDERNRLLYILAADIIGVITVFTDHVQTLKIPVPPLGHLGSVLYSSILAIGVYKHRTYYDILAQMRMKLEVLNEISMGIAHEIRNPLSSIKGAAKLLSDHLKERSNPQDIEYFTIIKDEIERLNNILTNYQFFTRPIKIEKELISLNEVIQKTVKLVEIDALHIKIQLDLSEDVRMIQADAVSMKQVFLNLIKNAADACDPDGELIIKTEYIHPWVKISFSDNGIGIPQGYLNRIFEPFFTTKTKGMGMGLAICQRIVLAHGGKIEVNNILPKGTRFSILLPI